MTTQVRQTVVLILMAKQKQPLLSEVQYLHMQSGTYFFGKKNPLSTSLLRMETKENTQQRECCDGKKNPTTAIFKS